MSAEVETSQVIRNLAREQMKRTAYLEAELQLLCNYLADDETVIKVVEASWNWAGLLALTNHRMIFIRKTRLRRGTKSFVLPYTAIGHVAWQKYPAGTVLRLRRRDDQPDIELSFLSSQERAAEIAVFVEERLELR